MIAQGTLRKFLVKIGLMVLTKWLRSEINRHLTLLYLIHYDFVQYTTVYEYMSILDFKESYLTNEGRNLIDGVIHTFDIYKRYLNGTFYKSDNTLDKFEKDNSLSDRKIVFCCDQESIFNNEKLPPF